MTSLTVNAPTSPAGIDHLTGQPEPGTRLRRRVAGATAITAGVVTMAGFLTCPWENGSGEQAYLESLLRNPPMAMLSMVLLHYGYLLFVPTVFVLARLARRRAPKLAAAGLVFGVLAAGLSGLLVTDAYDLAIAQNVPMAQALRIEDGMSPGGMLAIALPTTFGTMLSLIVVLAAMWRAGWISWLPVAAMTAGWVIVFGANDAVRGCGGAALVTVALVAVGVRVLRMTDEQFATGDHD